jgi:DNA-binding transcriptional ArsR family regulator
MMRSSDEPEPSAAQALSDPVRFAILARLLEGPATVGTLTAATGAGQSNVSNHLSLLRRRGFVRARKEGRQMEYRIARPAVAHAVEALMALGDGGRTGQAQGRAPLPPAPLAVARMCYDHLAGVLGVQILDGLVAAGALTRPDRSTGEMLVARQAARVFEALGVDVGHAAAGRRRFAFGCRDWTERRPHLGGSLGAAVCRRFFDAGWVVRPGDARAVLLTRDGREVLTGVLSMLSAPLAVTGVSDGRSGGPAAGDQ